MRSVYLLAHQPPTPFHSSTSTEAIRTLRCSSSRIIAVRIPFIHPQPLSSARLATPFRCLPAVTSTFTQLFTHGAASEAPHSRLTTRTTHHIHNVRTRSQTSAHERQECVPWWTWRLRQRRPSRWQEASERHGQRCTTRRITRRPR